jgi:hypothetical protein
VRKSDKNASVSGLGFLLAIGLVATGYGFRKWHNVVQPILDETAKVQLEIAQLELKQLKKAVGTFDQEIGKTEIPEPIATQPKKAAQETDSTHQGRSE